MGLCIAVDNDCSDCFNKEVFYECNLDRSGNIIGHTKVNISYPGIFTVFPMILHGDNTTQVYTMPAKNIFLKKAIVRQLTWA
jgi:hypothetical protein